MVTNLLMLEVGVLNITLLSELLDIDLGLLYRGPPTIVSQVDSVAKAFDAALEDVVGDVLQTELLLELDQHQLILAVPRLTGANIFPRFAHIPHFA